jgi:hypothetical protein
LQGVLNPFATASPANDRHASDTTMGNGQLSGVADARIRVGPRVGDERLSEVECVDNLRTVEGSGEVVAGTDGTCGHAFPANRAFETRQWCPRVPALPESMYSRAVLSVLKTRNAAHQCD